MIIVDRLEESQLLGVTWEEPDVTILLKKG